MTTEHKLMPYWCLVYSKISEYSLTEELETEDEPCGIVKFEDAIQYARTGWLRNGRRWLNVDKLYIEEITEAEYGTHKAFDLFPVMVPGERPIYDRMRMFFRGGFWWYALALSFFATIALFGVYNIATDKYLTLTETFEVFGLVSVACVALWAKFGES